MINIMNAPLHKELGETGGSEIRAKQNKKTQVKTKFNILQEGKSMKIGFIGLGNMACAIIGGILNKQMLKPEDIIGADKFSEAAAKAKETFGIGICGSNTETVRQADILFLAVKPVYLSEVIREIRDAVDENTVLVSIVAGKTVQWIEEEFGRAVKLVRCMPNTPALVGEGCTAMCSSVSVTEKEEETVLSLLRAFGKADKVSENLMDAVVGISGSAPAYVFMFIEAMADAAVLAGMPRKQAYEFAAQAVLGSAKMVLQTGKHPGELKDMVCSPAGTTIEAVKVLEELGMRSAVMNAVEACIEKSKNL